MVQSHLKVETGMLLEGLREHIMNSWKSEKKSSKDRSILEVRGEEFRSRRIRMPVCCSPIMHGEEGKGKPLGGR